MEKEQIDLQVEGRPEQPQNAFDTGIYAPEKIDVRWLWDFDYLWLVLEANLRGGKLKRNDKTENWEIIVPKGAQPFMNEHGIKDVMSLAQANINVITGSSVMKEERVLQWCERFQKDLADMLYINMKNYALEDAKFMAVISTIMLAYEANLRKSIEGKALMYATQAERVIETRNTTTNPQNAGIMGRIFGRR